MYPSPTFLRGRAILQVCEIKAKTWCVDVAEMADFESVHLKI